MHFSFSIILNQEQCQTSVRKLGQKSRNKKEKVNENRPRIKQLCLKTKPSLKMFFLFQKI